MKRNKFSETQLVKILEKFENGKRVDDLYREHNVGRSTIYLWRNKYGGMGKPLLKKLKGLKKENTRLKKIVAQQVLDLDSMKDLLGKDW